MSSLTACAWASRSVEVCRAVELSSNVELVLNICLAVEPGAVIRGQYSSRLTQLKVINSNITSTPGSTRGQLGTLLTRKPKTVSLTLTALAPQLFRDLVVRSPCVSFH